MLSDPEDFVAAVVVEGASVVAGAEELPEERCEDVVAVAEAEDEELVSVVEASEVVVAELADAVAALNEVEGFQQDKVEV